MALKKCQGCGATLTGVSNRRTTCSDACRQRVHYRKHKAIDTTADDDDYPSHFARQVARVPQHKRWRITQWLQEHPEERDRVVPDHVDIRLLHLPPADLLEVLGDPALLPDYGHPIGAAYEAVLDSIVTDDE